MKRIVYRSIVVTSLLAGLGTAAGSTRPHYGGTLRVELQTVSAQEDSADEFEPIAPWVFEGLVRLDASGQIVPGLAVSWEGAQKEARWEFKLRPGLKWHDGTALTANQVAESLTGCLPGARIAATDDGIEFSLQSPSRALPMAFATSPACSVRRPALHGASQVILGTGPFRLSEWQPRRSAILQANDDYWDGRPYLDRVEVQLGRSSRDRLLDLELDRADLVELDPLEARRAKQENKTVWSSEPIELLAILFAKAVDTDRELRRALSFSLDRASIQKVLMQNFGEATGSIFPYWVSGYAYLFPTQTDLPQARKAVGESGPSLVWKLGYSSGDSLTRIVAERVALNAQETGLQIQVVPDGKGETMDARLIRSRIAGPTLARSAEDATRRIGFPALQDTRPQKAYEAEMEFLSSQMIIPIAYVPKLVGVGSRVRNWSPTRWGTLNLSDVWLTTPQP